MWMRMGDVDWCGWKGGREGGNGIYFFILLYSFFLFFFLTKKESLAQNSCSPADECQDTNVFESAHTTNGIWITRGGEGILQFGGRAKRLWEWDTSNYSRACDCRYHAPTDGTQVVHMYLHSVHRGGGGGAVTVSLNITDSLHCTCQVYCSLSIRSEYPRMYRGPSIFPMYSEERDNTSDNFLCIRRGRS